MLFTVKARGVFGSAIFSTSTRSKKEENRDMRFGVNPASPRGPEITWYFSSGPDTILPHKISRIPRLMRPNAPSDAFLPPKNNFGALRGISPQPPHPRGAE